MPKPILGVLLAVAVTMAGHGGAKDPQGRSRLTVVVEMEVSSSPSSVRPATQVSARRGAYVGTDEEGEIVLETPTGTATLMLSPGIWVIKARATGHWSSPVTVAVPEHEPTLRLRLWPTGRVRARASAADSPAALAARFRSPPHRPTEPTVVPEGQVDCVHSGADWTCDVPAGMVDLTLRAQRFAPAYFWSVRISPRQELDLGALILRPGASVAGMVEHANGVRPGDDWRVRLTSQDGRTLEGNAPAPVRVDERGFFQIPSVLPADYLLEASGGTDRAVTLIRVLADAEARPSAALVLRPPLALQVEITPKADPWGGPWRVRLGGPAVPRSGLAPETASKDGRWRRNGLVPARYVVIIESAHNESRWYAEEIDLDADTGTLKVDLSIIAVRGSVRLGGEPLHKARVAFGGQRGMESVSFEADSEGRFEGALPRAGKWEVDVRADDPVVVRTLNVEVDAARDVEIALPDTAIVGTVVDESGLPQAALVTARSLDQPSEPPVQAPSKDDGKFRLSGLAPGRQLLVAQAMGSSSESDEIVAEARETNPSEARLVVRAQKKVEVRVVAAGLGVPGAEVKLAPAQSQLGMARVVRTDAQGTFTLTLPAATGALTVSASALGYAYRMLQTPLPKEGPLLLPLERSGGTLVLEWPPGTEGTDEFLVTVSHAGTFDDISYLARWARANGGTRSEVSARIPQLEPGSYTACRARTSDVASIARGQHPVDRCVSGNLAAGSELRLSLPAPSTHGN